MPTRRAFLPRQAKATVHPGFYCTQPVRRVRHTAVTTWASFAESEPGFSYSDDTLRWTGQPYCENEYVKQLRLAVCKIQSAIINRNMALLTSVEFDYCSKLSDLESTIFTIGYNIKAVQKISILAHVHDECYDFERVLNYDMALEFNQFNFQELPWQIRVTNSCLHELEYESDYEGGDY